MVGKCLFLCRGVLGKGQIFKKKVVCHHATLLQTLPEVEIYKRIKSKILNFLCFSWSRSFLLSFFSWSRLCFLSIFFVRFVFSFFFSWSKASFLSFFSWILLFSWWKRVFFLFSWILLFSLFLKSFFYKFPPQPNKKRPRHKFVEDAFSLEPLRITK